ncbi:SDR family NAD(P)-dependent oxidoreductase [Streptomyces sp. NEAU-YJ-81]|uniref:SDR family NAD(P)-dependent oxidoreductase n=1 Tax=Streptomyces sp. NEAU-YJ-81 TaxID=2820288 RepID=UPI0027E02983|nr:SDR family NAD(P)-dependent oxidoreductase [Streptomyces sp. NEAU-YJ-81]
MGRSRDKTLTVAREVGAADHGERTVTDAGFEETFQINYLAPYLLTNLLMEPLLASGATVIQTSSNAARLSAHLDLDDIDNARRYAPVRAYGNAKLALVLFTQELHRRYHDRGLSAVACHPGGVSSNFAQAGRSSVGMVFRSPLPRLFFQSPHKAARQLTWLATASDPERGWESSGYYERLKLRAVKAPPTGRQLWDRSAELVGLG